MAPQHHKSPNLSPPKANTVQTVVGTSLYYARAVDTTIIVSLDSISEEQANITESTSKSVTQMLNFPVTHYEAITRYHTRGMILRIHSNTSFLPYPESKSRAGVYN